MSVVYKAEHCNIPGCTRDIYKNYMCREHYDFYLSDERIQKKSDEIVTVNDGNATMWQRLLSFRDNLIHHALDIPMIRYEHFPLEHVYLLALRFFDKKDVARCKQAISDFDIPENENIAMMRRVVNTHNPDEASIGTIERYKFEPKELISYMGIWISVLGCVCSYFLLKFCDFWDGICFGLSYSDIVRLYKQVIPYVLLFAFFMWIGVRLARFYDYIAHRAYDLDLFENVADNVEVLNQIEYVKSRNQRSSSYEFSLLGSMAGIFAIGIYKYFAQSTFNIGTLGLFVCGLCAVFPLLYIYSKSVLYFPVFESLKRKHFKISLYNPDHNGGLAVMHRFLFCTFLYNEGIVCLCFKIWSCFDSLWFYIIFGLLVFNRANHAGWSIAMYISSVKDFLGEKRKEIQRLLLQKDEHSFDLIEKLNKVCVMETFKQISWLLLVVVIPYIINHIDEWYPHMIVIASQMYDYVKI